MSITELTELGFSDRVINAIELLTHKSGDYMEYIDSLVANKDAVKVKIQDLKDNLDTSRLSVITDEAAKRIKKYKNTLVRLQYLL